METYFLNRAKYGTHNLIAQEIGENNCVLDVGCSKGYIKDLAENNVFYGVDSDPIAVEQAKISGYQATFQLDLNDEIKELFCNKKFDIIIFGDILEHVLNPKKVLLYFINNYLLEGGKVIVSLPNVANISVRLNLLFGKFDYTEVGILDKTHLHLYTLKTAKELMKSCYLIILKEKFSSNRFGRIIKTFPFLGTILGFNVILISRFERINNKKQ